MPNNPPVQNNSLFQHFLRLFQRQQLAPAQLHIPRIHRHPVLAIGDLGIDQHIITDNIPFPVSIIIEGDPNIASYRFFLVLVHRMRRCIIKVNAVGLSDLDIGKRYTKDVKQFLLDGG